MLLVDSGASHNFIGQNIIDRMKVHVRKRAPVAVRLANGQIVSSDSVVSILCRFGKIQSMVEFQILPCSVTPILGMEFLKQLNPKIDWSTGKVQVMQGGRWVILPSVMGSAVSQVIKDWNSDKGSQQDEGVIRDTTEIDTSVEICSFASFMKGCVKE